jgi:hypothetical protein
MAMRARGGESDNGKIVTIAMSVMPFRNFVGVGETVHTLGLIRITFRMIHIRAQRSVPR